MTKPDLLDAMKAKVEGGTKTDAEKYLTAFQEVVMEALKKGDKVQLIGFGTFEVVETKEREVLKNPKHKELGKMILPSFKKPKFKAGKLLKDAVK